MATEQMPEGEEYVVLQDQEGLTYLLPRRTLEAARVPDDALDEVQALVAPEVSGYVLSPPQKTFTAQTAFIIGLPYKNFTYQPYRSQ